MYTTDHWEPAFYASHSDFQFQSTLDLFPQIKFPSQGRLLDIGCGDGKITHAIASKNPRLLVIGIDQSPSMVEFANQHYGHHPNLTFKTLDAHHLALSETFDCVVSFWTLAWLSDHCLFLRNCYRHLNQGGHIFLFAAENHELISQATNKAASDKRWRPYFRDKVFHQYKCSLKLYKMLVQTNRLSGLEVISHSVTYTFSSGQDLQNAIAAWLPHIKLLPSNERTPFLDVLLSYYQEQRLASQEEPLQIDCTGFIVTGEKPRLS